MHYKLPDVISVFEQGVNVHPTSPGILLNIIKAVSSSRLSTDRSWYQYFKVLDCMIVDNMESIFFL